jgi:hypothetical protein
MRQGTSALGDNAGLKALEGLAQADIVTGGVPRVSHYHPPTEIAGQ